VSRYVSIHGELPGLKKAQNDKIVLAGYQHQIAQQILVLDRKPFSLSGRPYLPAVYDGPPDRPLLLRFARQCEKSTTIAAKAIVAGLQYPGIGIIYINPSFIQLRDFSNQKLKRFMIDSPVVKLFIPKQRTSGSHHVMDKELSNRSHFYLRPVLTGTGADRTRGITADILAVDELQDILADHIPVVKEALSHSELGWVWYAGTPKTFEHSTEYYWKRSTRAEWIVTCEHCNKEQILSADNIGKVGPICSACGKPLDPLNPKKARWVAGNPKASVRGFRICKLMVPWIIRSESHWRDKILEPREEYSEAKFNNEVLALSAEHATRPLSEIELRKAGEFGNYKLLTKSQILDRGPELVKAQRHPLVCGIDWGPDINSATVLAVLELIDDSRTRLLFGYRFKGQEANERDMRELLGKFLYAIKPRFTFADAGGGGEYFNPAFQAHFPQRFWSLRYVNSVKDLHFVKGPPKEYHANRTQSMADLFNDIKERKLMVPYFETWDYLAQDILHIFSDQTTGTLGVSRFYYDHSVDEPDDFCHAMVYARLASKIVKAQVKRSNLIRDALTYPG